MIAALVGITLPTVAPMPAWTSGIAATWPWMIGRRATFSSWRCAVGSISGVQTFTGTRPVVNSRAIGMGTTYFPSDSANPAALRRSRRAAPVRRATNSVADSRSAASALTAAV